MPKISEAGGPTDVSQPGYFDEGRTVQSPRVVSPASGARDGGGPSTGEGDQPSHGNSSPTSGALFGEASGELDVVKPVKRGRGRK